MQKAGIQVVAISYDSVEALSRFAKQGKITFPLLSDSGSKTITAYGILNEKARGFTKGIPHPGTYLVGKDGRISAKLFKEGYIQRHTPAEIVKAAGKGE